MVIAGPVRSSLSLKERGLLMRYLPDGEQMKKADQYDPADRCTFCGSYGEGSIKNC